MGWCLDLLDPCRVATRVSKAAPATGKKSLNTDQSASSYPEKSPLKNK